MSKRVGQMPMLKRIAAIFCVVATLAIGSGAQRAVEAADEAEAAQRPPLSIPIFFSSRNDECYDSGQAAAITRLARREQRRINREGGIAGRRVRLMFLDDRRDNSKLVADLSNSVTDMQTVAMIGMANSTRAKAGFDAVGKTLKESNIPFLSHISVAGLIADYPNVFTTRASEDEERMPVIAELVKGMHFQRLGLVGLKDSIVGTNLGDSLKKFLGPDAVVSENFLKLTDEKLDPAEVAATIEWLKTKDIGLLFLSIGSNRNKDVLKQFKNAGFTPPILVSGRIDNLVADGADAYPNDIYQLAWDGLPDVYNGRLRKIIANSTKPKAWIFEGQKNDAAPGWQDGSCKPRDPDIPLKATDADNMRALEAGTRYADMVRLIAEATRSADPTTSIPDLRAMIVRELQSTYAAGRGTFQGRYSNWSFQSASRAASRTPLIVTIPRGLARAQLAPMQFLHLRNNTMRKIDTLYADIDLIRAEHIDDNEKTFLADFYLSMNDSNGASIDQIEFSNAYLEPGSNDRQITVRAIHDGSKSDAFPDHMKIYQVTGKFLFDPQLAEYPFDTQRFSIDIQPKHGKGSFIVQPPPQHLRDRVVSVDGWEPTDFYVGYDDDFIRTVDAQTLEPSVVPFYKASFVWLMKRETTDYFLRVVVPLGFIVIIAYLSIFISKDHFEAIVTIQVTALLSAVALYLALPKLDANTETLSDRLFLFSYLVLSFIIVITIARSNRLIEPIGWLRRGLGVLHILGVPAMAALTAYIVYEASLG